jgi:predicted XRE-type DNA-binding protein
MTVERFDSVWDALENSPAEAANMKARSGLMIAIQEGPSQAGNSHKPKQPNGSASPSHE